MMWGMPSLGVRVPFQVVDVSCKDVGVPFLCVVVTFMDVGVPFDDKRLPFQISHLLCESALSG